MAMWSSTAPAGWRILPPAEAIRYRRLYGLGQRVMPERVTPSQPSRGRVSFTGGTYRRHCSKCPEYSYTDSSALRQHCKSEWHVENVKRAQSGSPPLGYDDWLEASLGYCDSSEDSSEVESGGESESSTDLPSKGFIMDNYPWKLLDSSPRIALASTIDADVWGSLQFVVLLLFRSGRFAGCVWDAEGKIVEHTTFKKYTVRRKQGGAQRKFEQAKSMGAFMRRTQDAKIRQDVSEVVSERWKEYLENPKTLVLVGSPRQDQNSIFVGPLNEHRRSRRLYGSMASLCASWSKDRLMTVAEVAL
ncbi:Ankyrin repeat and zinc finger domain-containing protein 1 [Perkinsus olseni]|uniref:Ankyrin repeat and zinc finger domain-containing protein 1 n=2 Tax=Perkinsus olseni TaxID=32597 RepID=A0A7J6R1V6_PEROL|nr:Ankyrin repeat and zinc finger domain-containing protein 1 [Perkinsus olseni]